MSGTQFWWQEIYLQELSSKSRGDVAWHPLYHVSECQNILTIFLEIWRSEVRIPVLVQIFLLRSHNIFYVLFLPFIQRSLHFLVRVFSFIHIFVFILYLFLKSVCNIVYLFYRWWWLSWVWWNSWTSRANWWWCWSIW